jgi:hypothetical protein
MTAISNTVHLIDEKLKIIVTLMNDKLNTEEHIMAQQKVSIGELKVGSMVRFDPDDSNCEVVIDIYDEITFHTYSSSGTIMQYNISDVDRVIGEINIDKILQLLKNKIAEFNT